MNATSHNFLARALHIGLLASLSFLLHFSLFAQQSDEGERIVFNKLEPVGDILFPSDGIASLAVNDKYLYVVTNVNGVQIYDISEPFTPTAVGNIRDLALPTNGIAIHKNFIYISDNVNGIDILNITNPTQPISNASVKTASGESWDLCLDDSEEHLYVATGKGGVEIWNLKDPSVPVREGAISSVTWNYAWGVSCHDKRLFVADREGGLKIFDVSRPTQPKLIGNYTGTTTSRYAMGKGENVYLGNGVGGFEVLDIKKPNAPSRIFAANFNLPLVFDIETYALNQNIIFVATGRSGLAVYDSREFGKSGAEPLDKIHGNGAEYTHLVSIGHAVYVGSTDKGVQVYNYDMTPVFTNLKRQVIKENELLTYTLTGIDPDSSAIGISVVAQESASPVGFRYDEAPRMLNWTPGFEQSGIYTFKATIQEQTPDALARTESFKIEVLHINRAPTLPQPLAQLVTEDSLLTYTIPEATDPDLEDSARLSYFAQNVPRGAKFDRDTRTFSWTPDFTQSGDYTVKFTVKDANTDGNNDGKDSLADSRELTIRIDNVNLNPEFTRLDLQTYSENKLQTFTLSASDPDKEDEGKLLYKAVKLPEGATFDATTRTVSWTPTFEQAGLYVAEFEVDDQGLDYKLKPNPEFMLNDTMSVFIEVKQTNRAPAFVSIEPKTIKENEILTFQTPATDPDKEDAGKLSFSATNLPEGATFDTLTQTFSWKPTFEQSGNYTVSFKVIDTGIDGTPLSSVKEEPITVIHVNRPPKMDSVASLSGSENAPIAFAVSSSDLDKEDTGKLTITLAGLPNGATFDGKNFAWTPNYDQNGVYPLTFTVKDAEGLTDAKPATLTIANTNRPPKIQPVTVGEAQETKKITFVLKALDDDKEDNGKLSYKASDLPQGATFNPANQTFTWTPTYEQAGDYAIEFTVLDRGLAGTTSLQPDAEKVLTDKLSIPIAVKQLNRKPKIEKVSPQSATENEAFTLDLKATDPDKEDEGKLAFSISNLPTGATLEGNKLSWTPNYDQSGKVTLNVKATDSGIDGVALSDETSIVINIKNVNRPPKIADLSDVNGVVEQPISFSVNASDGDKEDEGKVKITAQNLPKGAKFKGTSFDWTPTSKQAGSYDVVFTATDKFGAKDTKTLKITVSEKSAPPAPAPDPPSAPQGQ